MLQHFRHLTACTNIAFAFEIHIKEADPVNPRASGGIIVVIRKDFIARHTCRVRTLHTGRAMAGGPLPAWTHCSLMHCGRCPSHGHAPRLMASDSSKCIFTAESCHAPSHVIGDMNSVDDVTDSVSFDGDGVGRLGFRARLGEVLFPRLTQVQAGLTHPSTAGRCMSTLDRLYTNMDAAEVLANNMQLRMMGGRCNREEVHSHPPCFL
eukprot:6090845-Amphidinium_carterae.1